MTPTIGKSATGRAIPINVNRLIETRAILTARSGGGKSYALRRILEQTHGKVQQIVIDPEGEFFTLREKFDYVLAGGVDGDCPANVRCAALLARKLLELRVSAIIDIYELKAMERVEFVKLFLESLIDAPKSLWHPVLVVIDEAQLFAAESGKCQSLQAVVDLMTRGRKRGFAGLLATFRHSVIDKNAAAPAINKIIGGASLDIDIERAAKDLGFPRSRYSEVESLKPGSFFAVGPAFDCDKVTEIKVGPVSTTHPRAGQRAMAPPPPRESVQKVLASLADLPAEA
jgi:DNA helicase HerA-like ATPase